MLPKSTKYLLPIFIIATAIFNNLQLNAQCNIPGASQTPQWCMPLIFKDGSGQRDTIYFGYDPGASNLTLGYDSQFNEYQWLDSTKFSAYFWPSYPGPNSSAYQPRDSGYVADIINFETPQTEIGFRNGQFPMTMYFDDTLFYSVNLPITYPTFVKKPRAFIMFSCTGNEATYNACWGTLPAVLCDSTYPEVLSRTDVFKVFSDSMVFTSSGFYSIEDGIIFNMGLFKMEKFVGIDDNAETTHVSIHDNLIHDVCKLEVSSNKINELRLYDVQGKIIQTQKAYMGTNVIDVSNLSNNMYVVVAFNQTDKILSTFKILKL